MPKANLYHSDGQSAGTVDLPEALFGLKVKSSHLHRGVVTYLSNQRLGTQSTKTRGEVSGGGKKPYKQKGTGMARQGSTRAVQWVGGGIAHAPKPRDHSLGLPKKMRRRALAESLSDKAARGLLLVVDELKFDAPKTKTAVGLLRGLGVSGKTALVVLEKGQDVTVKSFRNLRGVTVLFRENLNVYDVVKHEVLILARPVLEGLTAGIRAEGVK
jgi:large subunit ribosomal protein L4